MTPQQRSQASKKAARSRKRMAEARAATVEAPAGPVTKADRIKALLAAGKDRAEVAAEVGCKTAYVRAVYQRSIRPWRDGPEYRYLQRKLAVDPHYLRDMKRRNRDRARARYQSDPEYAEQIRRKRREDYARRRAAAHV